MPTVMIAFRARRLRVRVGQPGSRSPRLSLISGAGELAVVCGAWRARVSRFSGSNAYPAEVFMGDVGALALGGTRSARSRS